MASVVSLLCEIFLSIFSSVGLGLPLLFSILRVESDLDPCSGHVIPTFLGYDVIFVCWVSKLFRDEFVGALGLNSVNKFGLLLQQSNLHLFI